MKGRHLYCPNCGASNADDATFCKSCGTKLAEATAPASGARPIASRVGSEEARIKDTFKNAIALVRNPVQYMKQNNHSIALKPLMLNYVAILALVTLVGRVIGDAAFESGHGGVGYAIAGSIVGYILDLISVFIIGIVIWKLGPRFATSTDQASATTLAAYVYTPVFLIGILSIVPVLGYLAILGLLYGLYILYKGLPIMLGTPANKTVVYVIAILVVTFIIEIVISLILGGFDAIAK